MIPRTNKFPLRTEFLTFRKQAKVIRSPLLSLFYQKDKSGPQLAAIIPKKFAPLATSRNAYKRLILDSAWELLKSEQMKAVFLLSSRLPDKQDLKGDVIKLTYSALEK